MEDIYGNTLYGNSEYCCMCMSLIWYVKSTLKECNYKRSMRSESIIKKMRGTFFKCIDIRTKFNDIWDTEIIKKIKHYIK